MDNKTEDNLINNANDYLPKNFKYMAFFTDKYANILNIDSLVKESKEETHKMDKFAMGIGYVILNLLFKIKHYSENEELPFEMPEMSHSMLYNQLIEDLKWSIEKCQKKSDIGRENGIKGGRPKKTESIQQDNHNVNSNRKPDFNALNKFIGLK